MTRTRRSLRSRRTLLVAGAVVVTLALAACHSDHHASSSPSPSASSGSPTASATTSGPATFTPAPLKWGTCTPSIGVAHARCAQLAVPLDYADPGGAKIQLAVSMVEHTSTAAKYQGAILANPGGPGAPGLGMVRLAQTVPNGVGSDYDWIGFDPRGVGASRPALSCQPNYYAGPRIAYRANTAALQKKWLARSAAYASACGQKGGALLDHLTTVDNAMDMESIRKALGQKQISFYGYSYGTYLGQVYGTLYPDRVHRMVLDSNVDSRTVFYQDNLNQDTAFEKVLQRWFGWLASHDATYGLGRSSAAVSRLFYATQAALQAHPTGAVGGDEWNDVFTSAGYDQRYWISLGQTFAQWVHHHDDSALQGWYQQVDSPGDDNIHAIYLATECTDAPWPKSVAQNLADARRTYLKAPALTWQNMWFNAACLTWPAAAHTPVAIDGSGVASTLLIDQTLDAATPYAGSLETRKLFPHSVLLALPGGTTHASSLIGDQCEDDIVANYLATGKLPKRKPGNGADATCAPLPLPVP